MVHVRGNVGNNGVPCMLRGNVGNNGVPCMVHVRGNLCDTLELLINFLISFNIIIIINY